MYKGNQIPNNLETCYGNLIDSTNLIKIIKSTKPDEIYNLDDKRDWSCVQDYAESMWLMLQKKTDDYVINTCKSCLARKSVEKSFKVI